MRVLIIITLFFFCSIPFGIANTTTEEKVSLDAYRQRIAQKRSLITSQLQREHELELEAQRIKVLGQLQELGASKNYISARGFGGSVTTGNTTNTSINTSTNTSSVGNISNR